MDWNEIMEIENPHIALKTIMKKIEDEDLCLTMVEKWVPEYARLHNIDVYEMAFYPNGGRVLDRNDILSIEWEEEQGDCNYE